MFMSKLRMRQILIRSDAATWKNILLDKSVCTGKTTHPCNNKMHFKHYLVFLKNVFYVYFKWIIPSH